MRKRIVDIIVGNATVVLLVSTLLAGYCGYGLIDFSSGSLKVAVDASLTGLLPTSGDDIETYRDVRDRFGGDDLLLVAWFDDDLFTSRILGQIKRFAREAQKIRGVDSVDSLANALTIKHQGDDIRIDRLLRKLPKTNTILDDLKSEATSNPLYRGQLVSHDGRGALFIVRFETGLDSSAIDTAVSEIKQSAASHAKGIEHFVSGPVHARLQTSRILFRDVRLALPLAVFITAIVAAFTLRNIRGVTLPLIATGLGLALSLTLFVLQGHALNFVTAIMPPVVFVIGFAFAVHVVTEFDYVFQDPVGKVDAVTRTLEAVFTPLTLTAITTAIGFASLATSPIDSIRVFGIYTSLGTLFCWGTALTVIPAALRIAPVARSSAGKASRLTNFAPSLARFDIRNRRTIFLCVAILTATALFAASRVEVSTDYLNNFKSDHPVRLNFERVRTAFTGAVPLQILIESDVPEAFTDPIHLEKLADLDAWLESLREVGVATGVVDLIDLLNRAFNKENGGNLSIPATQGEVSDLLFLAGGEQVDRFLDKRHQRTLIQVSTSAVSTNDLTTLIHRIDQRLDELPKHLHGQVTGSSALLARTLDDIVRGQIASLGGALIVIYIILVVLFGSTRVAALALLPNVLPIVCFFGLLGLSGITLNLSTSLVAAVVLGIAVDDSIHFLSRFNSEARRTADEGKGVASALTSVIRPVTFTTAALCCGFLTLTLGELRSQAEFGLLAAATLFIAWVIDLVFTPALAGQLRFVTLWDVLAIDLGAAPHRTIPFFSGLSNRQARIAAILGTVKSFKQGDSLVTLGEAGNDIHVVIEGEAKAYVMRDGHEQILRQLRRGDLIGEVAIFRGQRTANVDATTDLRVLRIDNTSLARIQSRYPRIAARLYRNLAIILADRLADVTERL